MKRADGCGSSNKTAAGVLRRNSKEKGGLPLMTGLLLAAIMLAAAVASAFTLPPQTESALADAVAEAHIPAMGVAIVDGDGILFEQIYGRDANPQTPFLLGSLSKSFTALCILQLAEEGLLCLENPVAEYLESVPDGITIRQLLNQTAGYGTYQRPGETLPQEMPGTHIYSNLNYAMLSWIIEAVSGQSYEEYLQEHVLRPLGMERTTSDAAKAVGNGLAPQYENWFGFPVQTQAHFPAEDDWIQPGAGYLSSSLEDMARYLQMYLREGDSILSAAGIRQMFTQSVPVDDDIPYAYGLGWTIIEEPLPQTVYRHSGLVETGMTCMYLLPEEGLGVILMADMNDYLVGTDLLDRLGWNLVLGILGEEPGEVREGEYWLRHGLFDLLYLGLLAAGLAALLTIGRFRRRLQAGQIKHPLGMTLLLYVLLPTLLLLTPRLFLDTPLWVVAAFVPDLHLILWVSAAMLYAAGAARLFWMLRAGHVHPAPH